MIYPVPDPEFPTSFWAFNNRLIHGGIEAGPNAVLAFARRLSQTDFNPRDLFDALTFQDCGVFWRAQADELGGIPPLLANGSVNHSNGSCRKSARTTCKPAARGARAGSPPTATSCRTFAS